MEEAPNSSIPPDATVSSSRNQAEVHAEETTAGDTIESQINTYHCICNNLVLATTRPLSTLSRRAGSSLDKAYILPSPRPPRRFTKRMRALAATEDQESESSESDSDSDAEVEAVLGDDGDSFFDNLVILVSLPRSAGATIVRRSDGFEKRWLLLCGRCRLVVGYQLDWSQFQAASAEKASPVENDPGTPQRGRRDDVTYILPGALRSTQDMVEAKKIADNEAGFGISRTES